MQTLSIGLLGLGTVGSGVIRVLRENAPDIESRLGARLEVQRVLVRDADKPRAVEMPADRLTTRPEDVLSDPNIDIVVELVGGVTEACDFVFRAIEAKKHVVTANKALIASRGQDVFRRASENKVDVFYEGAVGGGIPIIRALRESLASDRILSIIGIVNGTTNFMLSEMSDKGAAYDTVLKRAQELGFAEADPSADVDGHDAAQKLAILSSLGFGRWLVESAVEREGITGIRPEDIRFAKEHGCSVKLVAIAERGTDEAVSARVHPAWVRDGTPLAHVDGAHNAVLLESEALGTSLFYGLGAGQMPTGSAVVSDIIDVARNIRIGATGRIPHVSTADATLVEARVRSTEDLSSACYMRFSVADEPGVLGRIATCLGSHGVSLKSVHQEVFESVSGEPVTIQAITHHAEERRIRKALAEIDAFTTTRAKTAIIRILDL